MKNILVPTDLTDCTLGTLKYATLLGEKSHSKMFFYHLGEKVNPDKNYLQKFITRIYREMKLAFDPVMTDFITEQGAFSHERIKKVIKKNKIDFVIMGASHESYKNTFFGSHVSDLINEVSCPVLSFPHGYNKFTIERIGFASELFDLPKRLASVIPFAKLFNAHIEVFHIYPVYPQAVDIKKYDTEKVLAKLKKSYSYDNISLHLIKTPYDNEIVTGIKKYISNNHPDLLVMFHKPRGWFDKFSFDEGATPSVIKSSPVPILALNKKSALKIS